MMTCRLTPTVIVPVTTADHTNINNFILNVMIKMEVTALTFVYMFKHSAANSSAL